MTRLTENEFKKLMLEMKAVYPKADFIKDQFAASIWYRALKDIPYNVLQKAFELYIQSKAFAPMPSDLREYAEKITTNTAESVPSFEEVWSMISNAAGNSLWNADATFEKLPDIAQKVVGSPEVLRTFGTMEEEFNTVQKSHSRRIYENIVNRMEVHSRYSQEMQNLITDASENGRVKYLSAQNEVKSIENKDGYGEARRKYENGGYAIDSENDFTAELKKRFGLTTPTSEAV